jgi:hypothetical protein
MRIFNTRCRRFRFEDPVWQELGDRPACAATFTALFYLNNLRSFVSVRYLNHLGFAYNIENLVFWTGSEINCFAVIECHGVLE